MNRLERLKTQVSSPLPDNTKAADRYYQYQGYREHYDDPVPIARAWAENALCRLHEIYIYEDDVVLGSLRSIASSDPTITDALLNKASAIVDSYGSHWFWMNYDHYAPDYETFLRLGVQGTLDRIESSAAEHADDPKKARFLEACRISMQGFSDMLGRYAAAALSLIHI